jgi:hypothetical protein
MDAKRVDGHVEVTVRHDGDVDRVRDVVAELGLPLFRLSNRLRSLDEVFLRRASGES